MTQYITLGLAVIGSIYTILTAVGNAYPKGKIGAFCKKYAAVLRKIEDVAEQVTGK